MGSSRLLLSSSLLSGLTPFLLVLLDELVVVDASFLAGLHSGDLVSAQSQLPAESGLGDHPLNVGCLVVGLVVPLDLAVDNVLAHVIELLVEGEAVDNAVLPLETKSVGALNVGESGDVLLTLDDNAEGNDSKIGARDASTHGLPLALTGPAGPEGRSALPEENFGPSLDQNALFHGESLLVVSAGDAEDVALIVITHDVSVDFLAHSPVEEGTDVLLFVDF